MASSLTVVMHDGQNDRGSRDNNEAASRGKKNEEGPQRIRNAAGLSRRSKSLDRYISIRRLILQALNPCTKGSGKRTLLSFIVHHIDHGVGRARSITTALRLEGTFPSLQTDATTGLTSSPSVSIRQVTTLPAASVIGGVRKMPTPAGVPVEMTSPGSSVMSSLM